MGNDYNAVVSRILEDAESVLMTEVGRHTLAMQYERAAVGETAERARMARTIAHRLRELRA